MTTAIPLALPTFLQATRRSTQSSQTLSLRVLVMQYIQRCGSRRVWFTRLIIHIGARCLITLRVCMTMVTLKICNLIGRSRILERVQLNVHEVTRPSFSRRLKGVACKTISPPGFNFLDALHPSSAACTASVFCNLARSPRPLQSACERF